ncbi:MAG: dTDP-4-dehydrorhamnose reductase [Gemmatimonadaceae bacterium]
MRALVTGAAGQLGVELLRTAPPEFEVIRVAHRECDITDQAQVDTAMAIHQPDVVINAAAYTAVDEAERQPAKAYAVNATGAGNVARGAEAVGARVIHISTDYVFDGTSREPYRPSSAPNPINVYGGSKLGGEKEVQGWSSNFLIIRSSWLYASHGKNFLRTILAALQAAKPLRIVSDLIGVPTSARSLALTIWKCVARPEVRGVHHWVDDGTASWFDFAVAIQEIALQRRLIGKTVAITPISWKEYKAPALRPPYSVLDARALSSAIHRPAPAWRNSLAEVLDESR